MVPGRQKVRTDGRKDGRTHGRRQNYIPPTSSEDNKSRFMELKNFVLFGSPQSGIIDDRVGCF